MKNKDASQPNQNFIGQEKKKEIKIENYVAS